MVQTLKIPAIPKIQENILIPSVYSTTSTQPFYRQLNSCYGIKMKHMKGKILTDIANVDAVSEGYRSQFIRMLQ